MRGFKKEQHVGMSSGKIELRKGIRRGLFTLALGCACVGTAWAQAQADRVFEGRVMDNNDGEALSGCVVRVKGKNTAGVTDADGRYSIKAQPGDVLVISYLGYQTMEVKAGSRNASQVFLTDDSILMGDVVVTGYQTLKKFNVTGAVNTISNEEISLRSSVGLEGILEGAVPGLSVYNGDLRIRGGASLNSGNDPLIIVDDFEVEALPENMDMVESITVLKDAAATAIWGSRASNGVIVITTKKGQKGNVKVSYANNFKVSAKPKFSDLHRASSEQIIDYDREAFLLGYNSMMGGWGYQGDGYSLSQEIMNDYVWDVPIEWGDKTYAGAMDPERLAEMDSRLAMLKAYSNQKQIKDNLMRNAFRQQHLVSLSGGTERTNYYFSGSFIGGHSNYVGDKERSFNINSRVSYKIIEPLTFRSDISVTYDNDDNGYTGLSSEIYNMFPFQRLMDENGNRIVDYTQFSRVDADLYTNEHGYLSFGKNLLDEVDMANNTTKNVDVKTRFGLDYRIMDGLSLSADYQYENYRSTNKNIQSKNSYDVRYLINQQTEMTDDGLKYRIPKGDILDRSLTSVEAWTMKIGATLNRSFGVNKNHYVNATAGFEMHNKHLASERYRKLGYDDQVLTWQPIDANLLSSDWFIAPWGKSYRYDSNSYDGFSDVLNREVSYYMSGVYTYDQRYTLSASMRIDKSNLFGVSDKYRRNPIWSVGANWNVKNEKFFHCDAVSALMLRASVGLTGNFDRSGRTSPVMVGRFMNSALVDGGGWLNISTPPNPLLRWERTRSVNVSADLGLFNRLNATVTYYHNKGYDLLGESQLDPTVGYSEQIINAANMTNHGVEVMLNADLIRTRDFQWNLGWVFGFNKNKITRNSAHDGSPVINRTMGVTKFVEGYAREGLWSYRWAGLDDKGLPQVYRADGTIVSSFEELKGDDALTEEDLEFSGTYQPKYSGSISTGFRYKNFQANFLFTYNFGHVFRVEYPSMNPYASSPALNERIGDRWRQPGDEAKTDIPGLYPEIMGFLATYQTNVEKYARYSSNSIRSGNMFRLREILLNYELPRKWLNKTPVERLSITAQLNNVYLWTANKEGYDPEAVDPVSGTFSLTNPIAFTCGVKLDF